MYVRVDSLGRVWTRYLICRSTWTISRSGSMVKVIGRRSRSPGEKMSLLGDYTGILFDLNDMILVQQHGRWCDVNTSYDVTL